MTSTWEEETKGLSQPDRDLIYRNANWLEASSSEWSYVIDNLRKDKFVSKKAMVEYLEIIRKVNHPFDHNKFKKDFDLISNGNALTGQPIYTPKTPLALGRAAEKEDYIASMHAVNGIVPSNFGRLLGALEGGRLTSRSKAKLYSCQMSKHGAWVTWDRKSQGQKDPFSFSPNQCANELRACIGFRRVRSSRFKKLFALRYPSTHAPILKKPTIADAGRFLEFYPPPESPPDEHDWYGLTRPWRTISDEEDNLFPDNALPRLPEAVHDSMMFNSEVRIETYTNKRPDIK